MNDDPKKLVAITLNVEQWQLDYSKSHPDHSEFSDTDFIQAVLNNALLSHIPKAAQPEMTDEAAAALDAHLNKDDVDPDIPF